MTRRISFRLPDHIYIELLNIAELRKLTGSEAAAEAIKDYINKHKDEQSKEPKDTL